MLPALFANTKRNLIAAAAATAILATSAAPALAWGQREQDFTKGVLATLLVGTLIHQAQRPPIYQPRPIYVQRPPVYVQRPPVYQPRPVYYAPAPISIYDTPTAQAFSSYTTTERRRIQSTLMAYGYYRGPVDGAFGPGTYSAVQAYAQHSNRLAMLDTRGGAYGFLDGLLF